MGEWNPFTGTGPEPIIGAKCAHCEDTIEPGEPAFSVYGGLIGRGQRSGNYMVVENPNVEQEEKKEHVVHVGCLVAFSAYISDADPSEYMTDTCPECGGPLTICKHCGSDIIDWYEEQERMTRDDPPKNSNGNGGLSYG